MMRDPTGENSEKDPAKLRFLMISINRLFGGVMVVLGLLGANGLLGVPDWFAYALIVVGLIEFVLVPQLLAKAWRTPRE